MNHESCKGYVQMFRAMASYISVTTIVVIFSIDYCITKP